MTGTYRALVLNATNPISQRRVETSDVIDIGAGVDASAGPMSIGTATATAITMGRNNTNCNLSITADFVSVSGTSTTNASNWVAGGSVQVQSTSSNLQLFGSTGVNLGISSTQLALGHNGYQWTMTPVAYSTGFLGLNSTFKFNGPAHTGLGAAEFYDWHLALGRTVTFADTNTNTDQRAVYIEAPVYSASSGGKTITEASTVSIAGAPTSAGTMTLTNTYAFQIESGTTNLQGVLKTKAHSAFTGSSIVYDSAGVQTTNSTQTTLYTLAVPNNTTQLVIARVVARNNTNNGDHAFFDYEVMVARDAAAAPVLGVVKTLTFDTTAGAVTWAATFTTSGNNLLVSVTGVAATTINWVVAIQYQGVSGAT